MSFYYTYVLLCSDGDFYIGSTDNLRHRFEEHTRGKVRSTSYRRPVEMAYFEACRCLVSARNREKQLKTGYGRAYLKRRLAAENPVTSDSSPA